jgi:glycosyltransferase involved in cell wall biosynthesis
LKVGIDVRELERGKATGIGQYLKNFLEVGVKDRYDWTFILFGNQNSAIDLDASNIKKIFIPEYFTVLWDQVQLPYYLAKEKIDVFLTPYFKAPLIISCKLVVIINDLIPILSKEYRSLDRLCNRIYFKALAKASTVRANKIIAISHHSKIDILKNFKTPEDKVEIIHLSVDGSYRPLMNNLKQVKNKYGIGKNYILYFGNFNPHKNVRTLLKAYSGLPREIKSQYQLVLGGRKDSHCVELENCARQLGIENNVIFTGFIFEEDLPTIYSAASLFIFPSLYEGFGLPPLEAMACGTPVIVSNTTSLPEVVGDAGILLDPENVQKFTDAILTVLSDNELKDKLREKGLSRAKKFTVHKTASNILNLLEKTNSQDKH